MKSLTELANLYATDKGTQGPSSTWSVNNYTDLYEVYLDPYRNSEINFLEIGLGVTGDRWESRIVHGRNSGGASIRMWYDYFSKAKIFGIDINGCSYLDNDRIATFVAARSLQPILSTCGTRMGRAPLWDDESTDDHGGGRSVVTSFARAAADVVRKHPVGSQMKDMTQGRCTAVARLLPASGN